MLYPSFFWPPDVGLVVAGHEFYRDSESSFLFRQLPSQVAERNSAKTGHMFGSECNLKMHVRNLGYTFPLQIGDPKTRFSDDFAT